MQNILSQYGTRCSLPHFKTFSQHFTRQVLNSITSIILVKRLNNRKIKLKVVAAVTLNFYL